MEKISLFGKYNLPLYPTQEERNVAIIKRRYEDYFCYALKAIESNDSLNFREFEHCIFLAYRKGYIPYLWVSILQNKAVAYGLFKF